MSMPKLSSVYQVSLTTALLVVISGLVLGLMNMLLLKQNIEMKASADQGARSLVLQPGAQLPPLDGLDTAGNKTSFKYGEDTRKTLLMVFSPGCGACKANMPNWQALAKDLDPQSYRIVTASLMAEGTQAYLEKYGLDALPAIAEPDAEDRLSYNLVLSPQLILIGADGKTEKVWTGALQNADKADVEKTLNVTLP